MRTLPTSYHPYATQRGSVLVISLIILTAVTAIAASALYTSSVQENIVFGVQYKEQAFNAAYNEHQEVYDYYLNAFADDSSANDGLKRKVLDTLGSAYDLHYTSSNPNPIDPGHKTNAAGDPSSYTGSTSFDLNSGLQFLEPGEGALALVEGASAGTFKKYSFEIEASSSEPSGSFNNAKLLSEQVQGFSYLGPDDGRNPALAQ